MADVSGLPELATPWLDKIGAAARGGLDFMLTGRAVYEAAEEAKLLKESRRSWYVETKRARENAAKLNDTLVASQAANGRLTDELSKARALACEREAEAKKLAGAIADFKVVQMLTQEAAVPVDLLMARPIRDRIEEAATLLKARFPDASVVDLRVSIP